MTHEDYQELLALEALGGAPGETQQHALQTHLASCAECRNELIELRDAAATLVYLAPPVAPPADLRRSIFANIRALSKTTPHGNTTPNAAPEETSTNATRRANTPEHADGSTSESLEASPQPASTVLPFARPRDSFDAVQRRGRAWKYGAVAASLVAVALLVGLVALWQRDQAMQTELARLSAQTTEAEAQRNRTAQELAREREAREIINAPAGRLATLAGTAAAPGARARVAYDQQTGRAVLFAQGLPPAPAGKAYQLWFVAGDKPLPGGVFTTDAEGRAVFYDLVPPEGRAAPLFVVTLEPSAGVNAPTGDKYLLGKDEG